jgi:hypothetical protein
MHGQHLLIEQTCDNLEFLTENTDFGRNLYIEGPFLMADAVNRNRRMYRKAILEKAVDRYMGEYVNERRAIGEINHPDYPLPDIAKAALMTQSLDWHDSNVTGKAIVLKNPDGDRLRSLIEAGFKLGVSSRGLGTVTRKGNYADVNDDLVLNAIDAVDMPSGQTCYVNALTESTIWSLNESGIYVKKGINEEKVIDTLREAHADPEVGALLMQRFEKLAASI